MLLPGPLCIYLLYCLPLSILKKGWWWLLFAAAVVAVTDLTGARIFKPSFERLRPCNDPEMTGYVRMVVNRCGSGFSFISNHAINHFGLAAFIFSTFRPLFPYTWVIFIWAVLIAFAQVYVGVHYPFDVLAGAILGIITGLAAGALFNKNYGFPIFDIHSTQ